jgi:SynChlorMet cassette protein ScmD
MGQIPVQNPVVVLREEFDDWAVLFNPDTAKALGVNPVGVAIWQLIDSRRSIIDIVAEIKELFSEVPETVDKEASDFVDILHKDGFLGYDVDGKDERTLS